MVPYFLILLARLPVVDGDDDDLAPRRQLVAREVVARAVRELAAVDVEHDRQQLEARTEQDIEQVEQRRLKRT